MSAGAVVPAAVASVAAMFFVVSSVRAVRLANRLRGRRRHGRREPFDVRTRIRSARPVRAREMQRADAALPDVLERVARSLRSGASLAPALAAAQPVRPRSLADAWRVLAAEAHDVGVLEAATRWRERHQTPAVRLTAAALAVSAAVGGPQARALDAVAATLRQRRALRAEVKALGAQARASASVVGLAPVAFAVIASGLEPTYLPFLFGTSTGLAMLGTGLALQLAGLAWMARISRVEG